MKEVIKYCIWLFSPIFKYGFLFFGAITSFIVVIGLIIVSIVIFEEYQLGSKKRAFIEREKNKFKELKVDIYKYDLNITDFNGTGCSYIDDSCKWQGLLPEYRYHLGIINEKGLRDGVGENYDYIYFENKLYERWIIGEWKNDTISGQAIEIINDLWSNSNDRHCQFIRYNDYPNDTLSYEKLDNYKLLITNSRQWATENLNY